MNDWQNWIAVAVALWCAWRVVREIAKPFVTPSSGCGGACENAESTCTAPREELLEIE